MFVYNSNLPKISFPYFEVQIQKRESQFSLCYQKETNQTLWIKMNSYIVNMEKIIV